MAKKDNFSDYRLKHEAAQTKERKKATDELLESSKDLAKTLKDQLAATDKIDKLTNNILGTEKLQMALLENMEKIKNAITEEDKAKALAEKKSLEAQGEMNEAARQSLSGLTNMVKKARVFGLVLKANPLVLVLSLITGIVAALVSAFTAARDLRAELGGGFINAGLIAAKLKLVELRLAATGFNSEKVRENFDAIRENLGGIEAASFGFLVNFSKTAQITGASAQNLAKILSIQESVSDASRETLLAQMEANSLMIEMKGIAPEAVFNDLAENAEFFATSMKAGTNNVMKTAIQARKLGLNLSTVAKISESLLDFESSIEKQMEASVLLGRQLNLDKARQLSFMDDQEGMMREILKQVGGEAEFEKLKGFQRRALADAVGVDVAELAKLARQKEGAAVGAEIEESTEKKSLSVAQESLVVLKDVRDDITDVRTETKKQTVELQN